MLQRWRHLRRHYCRLRLPRAAVVAVLGERGVALESFQDGNISFCLGNRRSSLVGR